jgi:DtxR family transcriptional regulator, Mn-dependent transcriptional regulator
MMTISKEDYLKAIAEAEAEGQTVIPATLAHWLSVTRPAVTFALKRLKKDGLVSIKKEGQISLTSLMLPYKAFAERPVPCKNKVIHIGEAF